MYGTGCQNFWNHKGQIRDIPRQNFRKNKGHGLGEKKQRPLMKIMSVCRYIPSPGGLK